MATIFVPKHQRSLNFENPSYVNFTKQEPKRGQSAGREVPHIDADFIINHYYQNNPNLVKEGLSPYAPRVNDPYNGFAPPEQKIKGFRPDMTHFAYGLKDTAESDEIPYIKDEGDKTDVSIRYPDRRIRPAERRDDISYSAARIYEVPIVHRIPTISESSILPRAPYIPKTQDLDQHIRSQEYVTREKRQVRTPQASTYKNIDQEIFFNAPPRYIRPIKRTTRQKRFAASVASQHISQYVNEPIPITPQFVPNQNKKREQISANVPSFVRTEIEIPQTHIQPTLSDKKQVEADYYDPDLDADIEAIMLDPIINPPERKKEHVEPAHSMIEQDMGILQEVKRSLQNPPERKKEHVEHVYSMIEKDMGIFQEVKRSLQNPPERKKEHVEHVYSMIEKDMGIFQEVKRSQNVGQKKFDTLIMNIPIPMMKIPESNVSVKMVIEELPDNYIERVSINAGSNYSDTIKSHEKPVIKEIIEPNQDIRTRGGEKEISSENKLNSLNITLKN